MQQTSSLTSSRGKIAEESRYYDNNKYKQNYKNIMQMKRKLLLMVCAVLGMLEAKEAYTISDLESTSWTLVTSTEGLTSTNYYLFVDAETSAYAMARTTNSRPVYVKLADPFSATHQVWKLEANNSKFYIQSNVDDYYFYSGNAGYND